MHNFKKPSDGKWWWQCFQEFSESQTNTKCIKTAQICGDAYAMKGTFRVTGRQLHLESEGSGILIATICNPRHGSNMPMKWSFKCQMGTTEIFFLCDSTSYFSLPLQTAHVRHSWSLGQGQFGCKNECSNWVSTSTTTHTQWSIATRTALNPDISIASPFSNPLIN